MFYGFASRGEVVWNYDSAKRRLGGGGEVSFRLVKYTDPKEVNNPVIRLINLVFRNCDPVFQDINLAFRIINRYTSNHTSRVSNHDSGTLEPNNGNSIHKSVMSEEN